MATRPGSLSSLRARALCMLVAVSACSAPVESSRRDGDSRSEPAAPLHAPTIDEVICGETEADRPTDKAWLRLPWVVPLLREDLVATLAVLESAQPLDDPAPTMGIQTLSVAVQTKSGDYVLSVTEQKVASHTYRVGLRPEGDPEGRKTWYWTLPPTVGRQLMHGLERRIADNMHLARRKGDVSKRALLAGSSAADDAYDVWVGKAEAEVRARYAAVAEDSGVTYWGGTGRRRLYFALRDGTQVWFELDFAGAVVAAGGPEPKARWQRHSGDSITVEQRAR